MLCFNSFLLLWQPSSNIFPSVCKFNFPAWSIISHECYVSPVCCPFLSLYFSSRPYAMQTFFFLLLYIHQSYVFPLLFHLPFFLNLFISVKYFTLISLFMQVILPTFLFIYIHIFPLAMKVIHFSCSPEPFHSNWRTLLTWTRELYINYHQHYLKIIC